MRLLVESDVLIDHILRHERHGRGMQRLLVMASFGDVELWASAHAICDVQCVVSDMVGSSEAQHCLNALVEVVHVCDISAKRVIAALRETGVAFDASLAEQTARAIGADAVVTRDHQRYGKSSCLVLSPEEVEARMYDAYGIRYEELALG